MFWHHEDKVMNCMIFLGVVKNSQPEFSKNPHFQNIYIYFFLASNINIVLCVFIQMVKLTLLLSHFSSNKLK